MQALLAKVTPGLYSSGRGREWMKLGEKQGAWDRTLSAQRWRPTLPKRCTQCQHCKIYLTSIALCRLHSVCIEHCMFFTAHTLYWSLGTGWVHGFWLSHYNSTGTSKQTYKLKSADKWQEEDGGSLGKYLNLTHNLPWFKSHSPK